MYEILIFILIVLPIALKRYLLRAEHSFLFRWGNFVIAFLLFLYFFSEFRRYIWLIYQSGIDAFLNQYLVDQIPTLYQKIVHLFYLTSCFFMAGLTLILGFRILLSRKIFLCSLPFLWLIISNYYLLFYISHTQNPSNIGLTIIIIGCFFLIPFTLIFLFYYNNKMKDIFRRPL